MFAVCGYRGQAQAATLIDYRRRRVVDKEDLLFPHCYINFLQSTKRALRMARSVSIMGEEANETYDGSDDRRKTETTVPEPTKLSIVT